MNNDLKKHKSDLSILRQNAEDLLQMKQSGKYLHLLETDALKLIHELEVQQIELEMQNQELILARAQEVIASEKYYELYDNAPMGYFTLSREGVILELNLNGAKMLEKEHSKLINSQFGFFVSNDTRPIYNLFLEKVLNCKTQESCEVALEKNDTYPKPTVHLTGIATKNGEHCLLTMVDISDRKLAADSLLYAEKRLQAEVMQRAQELENLNKALYTELVKYKASQKQLKKSLKDFKKLFTYVQKVREEERINIARIIHDDLAQLLTTLKIELTSHKGKIDDPELRMHHSIDSMLNLVDNCITSVTSVITELRPVILDEMGLIPSLKQLFSDFQNHTGITCDIRILEDSFPVKDEIATAVYRVAQEGLINIHNHSKATYLSVILACNPSFLSIILKDNGRGITPEERSDPRSFGIIGMKERIEEMNGKITFKGIPGKGTTVKLKVPFKMPD